MKAKSLMAYMKRYAPDYGVIISNKELSLGREKKTCYVPAYLTGDLDELLAVRD